VEREIRNREKLIIMGIYTCYPIIICHLVSLKNRFGFVTDEKFQKLIHELEKYEVKSFSDNDHLPYHTYLAAKLNYSQVKMNKLLKDLHHEIIEGFNYNPLIITDKIHILHISRYYEQKDIGKEWLQKELDKSIFMQVVLPVTPRIGEYIEIPFIKVNSGFSSDEKFYSGYVHDVCHSINGTTQEIYSGLPL